MTADADYARIVEMLTKRQLPAYVSYLSTANINGLGNDAKKERVVIRVSDGKVVAGSTHVKMNTSGGYDNKDNNPVTHPAFDPQCYRATGEDTSTFEGTPAIEIHLAAVCKSKHPDDNDYPFTTLYADAHTFMPLDVNGTIPESDKNKGVSVALDQHFNQFDGRVMPSSFKLDVTGSGLMFWLQVHLAEKYSDFQFLNSYGG